MACSKTQRTGFAYEIVAENFKCTAEALTVMDQLPVAQDQHIEVSRMRLSQEPTERTEQGILKWTFKLAPQEKEVIASRSRPPTPQTSPSAAYGTYAS